MEESLYRSNAQKRGNGDDPVNFRHLTCKSMTLKKSLHFMPMWIYLFQSLIKNRLKLTDIQKGFGSKIAGVLKHNSMIAIFRY